jgi:hypothetical protein
MSERRTETIVVDDPGGHIAAWLGVEPPDGAGVLEVTATGTPLELAALRERLEAIAQ